jgi:hypothetical protein
MRKFLDLVKGNIFRTKEKWANGMTDGYNSEQFNRAVVNIMEGNGRLSKNEGKLGLVACFVFVKERKKAPSLKCNECIIDNSIIMVGVMHDGR